MLILVLILLFFSTTPLCSAFTGNGSVYEIPISNMNYACYDGHGDDYNMDFSLVDQFVGTNNTDKYNTTYGFYGAVNYTGYSVGGPFDISIDAPASVTAFTATSATVQLTNQNPDFGEDSYLEYWIENAAGTTVTSGAKTVYVGSLSTVRTTVSLTAPGSAGTYYYYARVTWSTSYTASAYDTFTVTTVAGGEEPPGGGGTPRVTILDITEYPTNIILAQDDFAYYTIEVSNKGNKKAEDTFLHLINLGQYCMYSVVPESMDIEPYSNGTFSLKIDVPEDAETGAHEFSIKAMSGSVEDEVSSILNIIMVQPEHEIKITNMKTVPDVLSVDEAGKIQVFVENEMEKNTSVTMSISLPDVIELDTNSITKVLEADKEDLFEFLVIPKQAGTFEVTVEMSYDGKTKSKMIPVVCLISEEEEYSNALLIVTIVLVCVMFLLIAIVVFHYSDIIKNLEKKLKSATKRRRKPRHERRMVPKKYRHEARKPPAKAPQVAKSQISERISRIRKLKELLRRKGD